MSFISVPYMPTCPSEVDDKKPPQRCAVVTIFESETCPKNAILNVHNREHNLKLRALDHILEYAV